MSIINLLSEYKSKQRYYTEKSDAMEEFVRQKQSIDGIKDTNGYKEIKLYRERITVSCIERLRTMQGDNQMYKVQWELDIAKGFLDFLDNISTAELDKEDLDILTS